MVRREYNLCKFPIDAVNFCKNDVTTQLIFHKFNTYGFCGMALTGHKLDTMVLNSNRTPTELNFDCGHEIIHLTKHRGINGGQFNCFDSQKNSFYEWEANEGSAELLVPYKVFIPMYIELSLKYRKDISQYKTTKILSEYFNVSEFVISNRIHNLQYEIYQYFIKKCSLDNLDIYSNRQLSKRGLNKLQAEKDYCVKCYSVIPLESKFCCTCGQKLGIFKSMKGLGYMHYIGIETDSNNKAITCPRCTNEVVGNGDFCPTCGLYLKNHCPKCAKELSGKFRYCPICGCESTFKSFMPDWEEEQRRIEEEFEAENTSEGFVIPDADDDLPF